MDVLISADLLKGIHVSRGSASAEESSAQASPANISASVHLETSREGNLTFTAFKAAAKGLPRASLNIVAVQLLFVYLRSWSRSWADSLGRAWPTERLVPRLPGLHMQIIGALRIFLKTTQSWRRLLDLLRQIYF